MAIVLPDWTLWTARLTAEVSALQFVGLASDFTTAIESKRGAVRPSQAFVIPGKFKARELFGAMPGRKDHALTWTVAVVFSVLHFNDPEGERATSDFRTLQASLFEALLGWAPGTDGDVVRLTTGRRLGYRGPVQWWMDEYEFDNRIG